MKIYELGKGSSYTTFGTVDANTTEVGEWIGSKLILVRTTTAEKARSRFSRLLKDGYVRTREFQAASTANSVPRKP